MDTEIKALLLQLLFGYKGAVKQFVDNVENYLSIPRENGTR